MYYSYSNHSQSGVRIVSGMYYSYCYRSYPVVRVFLVQSSRVITIVFTTETSTSDGISLGTDLFA